MSPGTGANPNCMAVDPLVADPGAPHGIFVLEGSAQGATGQAVLKYLIPNPALCGVNLWVHWNQVDRGPQFDVRYDWSRVAAEMAPWEDAGKEVNLILIGAAEGASPTQGATPAYVLSQVQVVACGGQSQPTPVFWQASYEQNWHVFIAETVHHFATDRHVGYLRFGIGTGGEGLIAFEASLQSPHQLMIGLNQFDGGGALAFSNTAQAEATGIGFGQQGLKAKDVTDIAANATCVPGDWCHLFQRYAGTVPLEVQQLALSNPSGAPATPGVTGTGAGSPESVATGPLPPLLSAALSVHAQIFEVYSEDLLMTYDPQWPGHDRYGADYAAAFASLAGVVGTAGGAMPVS